MTARQAVLKALEVLVRTGWCKGHLRDKDGRHCAVGAANQAITGSPLHPEKNKAQEKLVGAVVRRLDRSIPETYFTGENPWFRVSAYNNALPSKKELYAWFRRAAIVVALFVSACRQHSRPAACHGADCIGSTCVLAAPSWMDPDPRCAEEKP